MDIIDLLQKKGILDSQTASQLRDEVSLSKKKPEKVILEQKAVDEELLFRIKSEAVQTPLKKVDAKEIPLKILELIPEDSARYYAMIPISYKNKKLEVGMVYPEDEKAQEALKFLARQGNFSYNTSLVTLTTFESLIKQYRNLKGEMQKALAELEKEVGEVSGQGMGGKSDLEERMVEDAPVTKMVAVILRNAVEGEASDIHIEPLEDRIRVRFRSLGQLHASLYLPLTLHSSMIARIKILSQMKIDEMRVPQDGRFSTTISGKNIDFRVSTFPTPLGEKVAIRILDPEIGLKSFEDLGLDGANLERVKKAAKRPFGLIIVSGPTGSGKSTTLYAILQHINNESINIVTIEDPVEYFIPGVNHSQVRPEIGYDFASGLRQILRQDPDVIMVGEIRDSETAKLAIHAALTGHIVLSTLHTNSAIGVISRLRDMEVEKYLLPSTLSIAIAQRLVRHLCEFCREKIQAGKEIEVLIAKELEEIPENERKKYAGAHFTIYKSKGCKKCGNTGYSGRVGIFEVFSITDRVSDLILKEEISEIAIAQEAKAQGMTTMRQDGILKVLDGITTIEEVIRVTT
ncbi:type II/IV secretion system protein [Patescibacteria group bacterium]|nr:type II/IV secretion system protein [Patescibacteria group bacterium]